MLTGYEVVLASRISSLAGAEALISLGSDMSMA